MQGIKVVTAQEMAKVEKGGDHEQYMKTAGEKVALHAIQFIEKNKLLKKVTLLIGKGNNGGDAFAAGIYLLDEGYSVEAYSPFSHCSELSEKFKTQFIQRGGKFTDKFEGLIIDGLLGTGFQGKVKPEMAEVIEKANQSECPILSIDVPSGLNATTGDVDPIAIQAEMTVTLGLAKIGLFIHKGWRFAGKIRVADFGLSDEQIAAADAIAFLPKNLELPHIDRARHKYQSGYSIGYAGSKTYSGAAKLAGLAALKTGAGIVRIFYSEDIGPAPLELICQKWNKKDWENALEKAKSAFIGPGLNSCKKWLQTHLKNVKIPLILDASALLEGIKYPKFSILTPHRGEVLKILGLKIAPKEETLFAKTIKYCSENRLYIVLKGAPTFIFGNGHKPVIIPRGDPGMATAGTGDVLTGMIAGLLSEGVDPYQAAILGPTLHAIAGEMAAEKMTSYSIRAQDLIEFIPDAIRFVLAKHDIV